MTDEQQSKWLLAHGFEDELAESDEVEIKVLSVNLPTVHWFFDLTSSWRVEHLAMSDKRLIHPPTKQDILASAQLLRFDYKQAQYEGLKMMLTAARAEIRL